MAICSIAQASKLRSSFVRMDPEFFKPIYMQASQEIEDIPGIVRLGHICERITQGSNPKFSRSGMPCVNGKNVYFGTMLAGEPNYVTPAEFERLRGYVLRKDDLVITLKHATKVGRVWLVEDDEPRIFSRNVGLIRLTPGAPYLPSVLLLYLWSRHGQLLLDRCATGGTTGQITLPTSELKRLPIPPIAQTHQRAIDKLFQRSREADKTASDAVAEAKALIARELKLEQCKFTKQLGYTTRLSDAMLNRRIDADYYQVPFRQLNQHLDQFSTVTLGQIARLTKGIEVGSKAYLTKGVPFLRVSNITEQGVTSGPSDKFISPALYSRLTAFSPKAGEVLLTKDGSPGVACCLDEDVEGIISAGVVRLSLNTDTLPRDYLATVLNTLACRMQVDRECSGAVIVHWKPSAIRKLRIPVLPCKTMSRIADLNKQSRDARTEASSLLEQAKARVEQLIEEAIEQ